MDILLKDCKKAVYIVFILLPHLQAQSLFKYLCPEKISLSDQNADSIWIQNGSYISFEIKCDNHPCLMLHQRKDDCHTNATEIHLLLKDSGLSFIIDSESRRFNWTFDPSLLSPNEYRQFWISWTSFDIRVGKGDEPYKSQILQLSKLPYAINYLSTGTNCSERRWRLKRNSDTTITGITATQAASQNAVGYSSATSKSSSSSYNEEAGDNEGMLIVYVSVSVVVVTAVVITLTIYLVHRRNKRRRGDEESAVYNGIDSSSKRRSSVPGIMNRAYSSYTLEIQDNRSVSNTGLPKPIESLYTKIDTSRIHSCKAFGSSDKINDISYPQGIEEDKYGYNHIKKQKQPGNDTSYSHVTKTQKGFEVENDTSYSHIVRCQETLNRNLPEKDNNTGSMYNLINASQRANEEQFRNIPNTFGDQDSTYDHAKAGGPDPQGIKEADEYSHLSESKEKEQSDKIVRHGYENVLQATEMKNDEYYQFLEQGRFRENSEPVTGFQSDEVNYANESEVGFVAPRLRYVNVTKNEEGPFTISDENVTREYEEVFGHTPSNFTIEP